MSKPKQVVRLKPTKLWATVDGRGRLMDVPQRRPGWTLPVEDEGHLARVLVTERVPKHQRRKP